MQLIILIKLAEQQSLIFTKYRIIYINDLATTSGIANSLWDGSYVAARATSCTKAAAATTASKASSATSATYSSTANYAKNAGTASYNNDGATAMDRLRGILSSETTALYSLSGTSFQIKTAANVCPVYMYYESSSGNFVIRIGTSSSNYKYFIFKADGTTSF